ncbi:transposable element Tc1 transposase [Trichonephila clavipes]|nr:transposable element Tc1 transposase [Trichonephila clavipes]
MFSDESLFHLCPDDHGKCIWRQPGKRADPAFTIAHYTGTQQEVMVWGAISFEAGSIWSSLEAHLQHIGTCCYELTALQLVKRFLDQPDLSPIEHVWDMMGSGLHLLENVDDLTR